MHFLVRLWENCINNNTCELAKKTQPLFRRNETNVCCIRLFKTNSGLYFTMHEEPIGKNPKTVLHYVYLVETTYNHIHVQQYYCLVINLLGRYWLHLNSCTVKSLFRRHVMTFFLGQVVHVLYR